MVIKNYCPLSSSTIKHIHKYLFHKYNNFERKINRLERVSSKLFPEKFRVKFPTPTVTIDISLKYLYIVH